MPEERKGLVVTAHANLIVELKRHVGYKDRSARCMNCAKFKDEVDPNQDRSWIPMCTQFAHTKIGPFIVNKEGCCDNYVEGHNPAG